MPSAATALPNCASFFARSCVRGRLAIANGSNGCNRAHRRPLRPARCFRAQSAQAIEELQRFQHAIDDRLLAQAVELIATATQVHLLAARRSFPVAAYLAYALNQLEVRTQLLDNVGGMNREFAARIDADEVVVAISFRNYTGKSSRSPTLPATRRRGDRDHRQQAVSADARCDSCRSRLAMTAARRSARWSNRSCWRSRWSWRSAIDCWQSVPHRRSCQAPNRRATRKAPR